MRGAPLNTPYTSSASVQSPVTPAVTDETSWTKFTVFASAEKGGSCPNLNFSVCHPSPPSTVFVLSAWEGWRTALVVTNIPWDSWELSDFIPPWCSLWLTCLCFEPRLTDWFSLPWCIQVSWWCLCLSSCHWPVILAYRVCSSLSAFPPCVCSAPSCEAWANILIFPSLQAEHCSGLLGFLCHGSFLLLSLSSVQTMLASALPVMHVSTVPPACLFGSCFHSPSPRK